MSLAERAFARPPWRRRLAGGLFLAACLAGTGVGLAGLALLAADVLVEGWPVLSWDFLTSFPSRDPDRAGIRAALFGTLWVMALTALVAVPAGIGAAVYLQEFAPRNRLVRFIQLNIANLAGVPSIVYGILGLALFVRTMELGRSVLAGALTLALLVLPVVIIAAQEALRAVPDSLRHGALALGASRWQTVRAVVLPAALPGMLTGVILALSRAAGETAPLIMIGALTFVPFTPSGPLDRFTVLPIQTFNWAARPQPAFHHLAAGAIIVLLALLLAMNAAAVALRQRLSRRGRL
ncbi:MAG TPA: phosphate ABC transporter permease PstA [Dehalococcoidia bacterium]